MDATRVCSVDGCSKPHDSHGYCGMHAQRMRRGRALDHQRPSREDYFLSAFERTESCWLWNRKIAVSGYGQFSGDSLLAHRYSYELFVGPIPDDLQIDHLCGVKRCVNPAHLEAVTRKENLRRRDLAYGILSAVTACPQGHPYDDANTYRHASGRRQCRACSRERAQRNRERKKQ